ncbi:MAG: copper resistance protein CopC [Gemmatimonas sp.]
MNTFTRRAAFAVALTVLPALFVVRNTAAAAPLPTVARFHLALSKSEPAANDTTASPKAIKLWFTETVTVAATRVQVTGPDKKIVATGPITIAAAAKSPAVAEIKETLKPGAYAVEWKTLADDGHPSKGTFVFTVGMKKAAQ